MVLTALGGALVLPSVPMLAGAALLVAAIQLQVRRVEEPHLRRVHGADYDNYCTRVGRFLPGTGSR